MGKISSILIVEDEAIYALSLKLMLSRAGYRIVGISAKGENAINDAVNKKPELILMDIRLGGHLDGIETVEKIKEQVDIPVIFMTAYSDKSFEERAKRLQPLGYCIKPLTFNDIENRISSYNTIN